MQQFLFPVLYLGPKNEKTIPRGAGEITFAPGPLYELPYAALNEADARDLIKRTPDLFAFPPEVLAAIEAFTVPAQEAEEGPEEERQDNQDQGEQQEGELPNEEPLPEDFPGYDHLLAAGLNTYATLAGKTRDDLIALKGIGAVTADAILAALEPADVEG